MSQVIRWGPFWDRKSILIPNFNLDTMCPIHGTRLGYTYRGGDQGWLENKNTGLRTPNMYIPAYMVRYCTQSCSYQCIQDIPNQPIKESA